MKKQIMWPSPIHLILPHPVFFRICLETSFLPLDLIHIYSVFMKYHNHKTQPTVFNIENILVALTIYCPNPFD